MIKEGLSKSAIARKLGLYRDTVANVECKQRLNG